MDTMDYDEEEYIDALEHVAEPTGPTYLSMCPQLPAMAPLVRNISTRGVHEPVANFISGPTPSDRPYQVRLLYTYQEPTPLRWRCHNVVELRSERLRQML
jgi:hypothetical protein